MTSIPARKEGGTRFKLNRLTPTGRDACHPGMRVNITAKGFSDHSESSSLGGEEFGSAFVYEAIISSLLSPFV